MKAFKESGLFLNNSIRYPKLLAFINATIVKKHGCLLILKNHSNKAVKTVKDSFIPHIYGWINRKSILKKNLWKTTKNPIWLIYVKLVKKENVWDDHITQYFLFLKGLKKRID